MRPSTRQNCGVAGLMRAAGVGPLSATVNGFGSVNAAASILAAPVPAPDNAAHAAAASVPRLRSAAVAMVGSVAMLHRITDTIAVRAGGAAEFVIIWVLPRTRSCRRLPDCVERENCHRSCPTSRLESPRFAG